MLTTVAKNSFFVFLARIVDVISVFLLIFLIARYLTQQFGLASFGQYGFITTFVTFLFSLGYAGISQITIREVAQNREQASRYLRASLLLRSGLSFCLIALIAFFAFFIRHETAGIFWAIILMAISETLSILSLSFLDILNAHELMHYDTVSTLLYRLTTLVITIIAILLKGSLWYFFFAIVIATLLKAVFLFAIYRKKISKQQVPHREPTFGLRAITLRLPLRYLAIQAAPIALAFLITQAYMKTGVLFLRGLSTSEQIALFYAPLRLLFQFQFIPFALSMALFPVFSRVAKTDNPDDIPRLSQQKDLSNLFIRAFRFSVILCVPVIVIFLLLAEPIMLLIFGDKFKAAVPCLQILMISFPVTFLELLMNNFLITIKRQKLILICNTLCLATNLGLNILLIPRYGAIGASWATSIAYLVLFFAFFYFVRQFTGAKLLLATFPKPILAGLGMALALYFTHNINWIIFGLLSFAIYLVFIYGLKGVTPGEIRTIKSILKPYGKADYTD